MTNGFSPDGNSYTALQTSGLQDLWSVPSDRSASVGPLGRRSIDRTSDADEEFYHHHIDSEIFMRCTRRETLFRNLWMVFMTFLIWDSFSDGVEHHPNSLMYKYIYTLIWRCIYWLMNGTYDLIPVETI